MGRNGRGDPLERGGQCASIGYAATRRDVRWTPAVSFESVTQPPKRILSSYSFRYPPRVLVTYHDGTRFRRQRPSLEVVKLPTADADEVQFPAVRPLELEAALATERSPLLIETAQPLEHEKLGEELRRPEPLELAIAAARSHGGAQLGRSRRRRWTAGASNSRAGRGAPGRFEVSPGSGPSARAARRPGKLARAGGGGAMAR